MRETNGRNAKQVEAARKFAAEKNVNLRTAELDVSSQESADRAVQQILSEAGPLHPLSAQNIYVIKLSKLFRGAMLPLARRPYDRHCE